MAPIDYPPAEPAEPVKAADTAIYAEQRPAIAYRTPGAFNMNTFRVAVGPGWYESSRDLKRGLTVLESLPAEMALNDWLKNSPNRR